MATRIVVEQEKIIGPVAYSQAETVEGLTVNRISHSVTVTGNGPVVVDTLVESYKDFFGNAAVDVCKEAVKGLITSANSNEIPHLLK